MNDPKLVDARGVPLTTSAVSADEVGIKITSDFSLETGRGRVRMAIPNIPPMWLMPHEARILGMRLLAESEIAMDMATGMRILLEFVQMPTHEAVELWSNVSQGTRVDHAMAFHKKMDAQQKDKKLEDDDGQQH